MTSAASGDATLGRPVRELPLVTNSVALVLAKVAAMGLGFLFWVAAARTFGAAEVGVAAAIVAAMMLCTQLALLGIGSSFIAEFATHKRAVWPLLDAALAVVVPAALLAAGAFLVLSATLLDHVDVVAKSFLFAVLFVAATVLGTVGVLLDQVSTALRRGDQNVVRGLAFGATCVVLLLVLVQTGTPRTVLAAFAPWAAAGVVMCGAGALQLRRVLSAREAPPVLDRTLTRRLLHVGIPNHVLTLAERTPGLVLPLIVTQVLTPRANAAWYAAWMMAWVVYIVPIQVGMTIFAEVAADPGSLRSALRRGVMTTLALGGAVAAIILVAAHPLLSVLGAGYADEGAAPLRILVLGIVPMTFTFAYFAACRGLRRVREAMMSAWVAAICVVVVAVAAGGVGGLTAIAVGWLAVQAALGVWSAARLVQLARSPAPHAARSEPPR
jgi:O-antigen/teichoic acid export membrane protein